MTRRLTLLWTRVQIPHTTYSCPLSTTVLIIHMKVRCCPLMRLMCELHSACIDAKCIFLFFVKSVKYPLHKAALWCCHVWPCQLLCFLPRATCRNDLTYLWTGHSHKSGSRRCQSLFLEYSMAEGYFVLLSFFFNFFLSLVLTGGYLVLLCCWLLHEVVHATGVE